MLETRIGRLKDDMIEVKASFKAIESALVPIKYLPTASDYATLKADIARLDGRMSQIPTAWTMFSAIVMTWGAGAAIVFTLLRYARP